MGKSKKKLPKIVLGIDIGGTGIKGALVDTRAGVLTTERHRIPTPQPATPKAVAHTVAELIDHFKWKGRLGCTLPARVRDGVAETAVNIDEAWLGVNAKKLFGKKTGLRVGLLNDADAAGLAEARFGAGRGKRGTVVVLTFGTGIGSVLIVDGTLVPNTELGQLHLCGTTLEGWAANSVRERKSMTWDAWAERVQTALEHVEYILAPDLIVVGGGVSKPHRWQAFGRLLETRAKLVPAQLANNAGIIGAAWTARKG